ncbi:MAG: tetratricopeptide repeat protein [Ignavibacteria bacterium]
MIKRFFFLFVILSCSLFAQNDIPGLIYKGLDYSYNFQFRQAEDCFQQIIDKYPDDARGYHYKSGVYLWTYLSNKEKSELDKFMKFSDFAIDKAKKMLDNNDNDENALYVLGANYGFRAMVYAKESSSFDAVRAAKNSGRYLNKTLETNPHNNDAYMGKGLLSFAFSFVPGVFKWVLNLAGFSGSVEEGIDYLQKAYKYGRYSKTEASYYLSQIYSEILVDYSAAANYLQPVIKKYPYNTLFKYSLAVVEIKDRKPQLAEKLLKEIIKADNSKFTQVTAFSNFLLGDILFHGNDFTQAIVYYQKFLSTTHDFDYSGIAYFRTALCYELSGNRSEAQRNYILARNGNLDVADDIYAKRKSEIYYDCALTEHEMILIKSANMIESGKFTEAFEVLNQLLPKLSSEKLKAEADLYMSDALFETGRVNESIDFANKATRLNAKEEKWIKPFALYFAARGYAKTGGRVPAKKNLEQAEDMSGYDYQQKLKGYINALKITIQ